MSSSSSSNCVTIDFDWNETSLHLAIKVALSVALVAWTVSRESVLNNTSTVDRLWSLLPAIYAWMFVLLPTEGAQLNARSLLVTGLVSAWSARLTYNFVRKGGYNVHAEDYRWIETRRWFQPWWPAVSWELFNLVFICLYQSALILAFSLPVWAVVQLTVRVPAAGALDTVTCAIAALHATLLYLQTLADEEQWQFHIAKQYFSVDSSDKMRKRFFAEQSASVQRALLHDAAELMADVHERGFRTTGVFAYSRHLNFFCEQSMWWCVFAFYVASAANACSGGGDFWTQLLTRPHLYWPGIGALLLSLLFQGSTWLTERITASKYPRYREYQRAVPKFLLFK
jgi:steroid 5-alpha reductase family enzyme